MFKKAYRSRHASDKSIRKTPRYIDMARPFFFFFLDNKTADKGVVNKTDQKVVSAHHDGNLNQIRVRNKGLEGKTLYELKKVCC